MIVRPFNVYGPGMKEADYRVLPNFANSIKAGKALTVYGTGLQTRTFCFVEDAIVGFLQVLLSGRSGEAYNIGNPSPEISMRGLVDLITKLSTRPVKSEVHSLPGKLSGGRADAALPRHREGAEGRRVRAVASISSRGCARSWNGPSTPTPEWICRRGWAKLPAP